MKSPESSLRSYQSIGTAAALSDAGPYEVVDAMLDAFLARAAEAKGHLQRNEIAAKTEKLGKGLAILEALTMSLDTERGGEIAANLGALYEYASLLLTRANLGNDAALIDEAIRLMRHIKSGWEGIPVELRN